MDIAKLILMQVGDSLAGNRLSLEAFCAKYLRHHFPKNGSQFHTDLKARLDEISTQRNAHDVWCSPRGNAKSTIVSLAYPLYCMMFETERYIVLVGDTHAQAVQFLSDIKVELENNELLKADFPHATGKGAKWKDDEIVTRNNIMLTAMGMRGKIRGRKFGNWRPTLVIIDDPENDESVISPRQRERTMTWLVKGALACGVPQYTNFVIVGTVINADCLVENLRTMPGWRARVYASIVKWPARMDLWAEWEAVYLDDPTDEKLGAKAWYLARKAEMDEGASVLWPEHEDLYKLMCLRCDQGHLAFESEKQNSPVNPAQCRFPGEYFEDIWVDNLPELPSAGGERVFKVYGSCDPSLGKDGKRGDYAPIITIWWKKGHKFLYIDCDMARRPPGATIDRILAIDAIVDFQAFAFESNGFQTVMGGDLHKKSVELGQMLPLVLINHTQPKPLRIERLGIHLQNKSLKFLRTPGNRILIKQLSMFPIGDHDDGPDALEMAIEIVRQGALKKGKK